MKCGYLKTEILFTISVSGVFTGGIDPPWSFFVTSKFNNVGKCPLPPPSRKLCFPTNIPPPWTKYVPKYATDKCNKLFGG